MESQSGAGSANVLTQSLEVPREFLFLLLGPYLMGTEVTFSCRVNEAKPQAGLVWLVGGQEVEATEEEVEDLDGGASNLHSTLTVGLEREHVDTAVACR